MTQTTETPETPSTWTQTLAQLALATGASWLLFNLIFSTQTGRTWEKTYITDPLITTYLQITGASK